jgi:hypothetical protein
MCVRRSAPEAGDDDLPWLRSLFCLRAACGTKPLSLLPVVESVWFAVGPARSTDLDQPTDDDCSVAADHMDNGR